MSAVCHRSPLVTGGVRSAPRTPPGRGRRCGITPDYLYQIERGKKLPTIPVLAQLAQVLRVPLSRLLDDPAAPVSDRPSTTDAGMVLYRALTQPIVPYEPPPLAELHGHVRSAWRIWQTSSYRYSKLVNQLPVLITDTALAEQRYQSEGERPERRQVQCCAVDLYGLLRTVAKRVGRVDLSLLVADRAIRAAETLAPYVQASDLDGSGARTGCGATGRANQ